MNKAWTLAIVGLGLHANLALAAKATKVLNGETCMELLSRGGNQRLPHFTTKRGDLSRIQLPTPQFYSVVIENIIATPWMRRAILFGVQRGSAGFEAEEGLVLPHWNMDDGWTGAGIDLSNKEKVLDSLGSVNDVLANKGRLVAENIWGLYIKDFHAGHAIVTSRDRIGALMAMPNGEEQIIHIIHSSLASVWDVARPRLVNELNAEREMPEPLIVKELQRRRNFGLPAFATSLCTTAAACYVSSSFGDFQVLAMASSAIGEIIYSAIALAKLSDASASVDTTGVRKFSKLNELSNIYEKVVKNLGIDLRSIEPQTPTITIENADWNKDLVIPDFKPSEYVGDKLKGIHDLLLKTPQDLEFNLLNFSEWITGSIPEAKMAYVSMRLLGEDLKDFRKTTAEYENLLKQIGAHYDSKPALDYSTQINVAYMQFVRDLTVRIDMHRTIRNILLSRLEARRDFIAELWANYKGGEANNIFSHKIDGSYKRPDLVDEIARLEKDHDRLVEFYRITDEQFELSRQALEEIARQFQSLSASASQDTHVSNRDAIALQISTTASEVERIEVQMADLFMTSMQTIPSAK